MTTFAPDRRYLLARAVRNPLDHAAHRGIGDGNMPRLVEQVAGVGESLGIEHQSAVADGDAGEERAGRDRLDDVRDADAIEEGGDGRDEGGGRGHLSRIIASSTQTKGQRSSVVCVVSVGSTLHSCR